MYTLVAYNDKVEIYKKYIFNPTNKSKVGFFL